MFVDVPETVRHCTVPGDTRLSVEFDAFCIWFSQSYTALESGRVFRNRTGVFVVFGPAKSRQTRSFFRFYEIVCSSNRYRHTPLLPFRKTRRTDLQRASVSELPIYSAGSNVEHSIYPTR